MKSTISEIVKKISLFSLFAASVGANGVPATAPIKVVSLSPQVSDLLVELGKGKNLVGSVQMYGTSAGVGLDLGSYLHPNLERLFSLRPDWVLTDHGVPQSPGRARWEGMGTKTSVLNLDSVQELGKAGDWVLEKVFGERPRLSAALMPCLSRIRESGFGRGGILIFVSLSPPFLAGRGTFLDNLAEIGGYKNLAEPSWRVLYPQVSDEWLLSHEPSTVFFLDYGIGEMDLARRLIRQWWPGKNVLAKPLPESPFARAGLAALKQWESWGGHTPSECHGF